MCGIFSLLNYQDTTIEYDMNLINSSFLKGKGRGPEHSILKPYIKSIFGFHRLAINGLNSQSHQPIVIKDVVLVCNGEIYNYKELYQLLNVKPSTQSDCEVIIHLYLSYGIEQTLNMIDGEFSFILFDNRITNDLNNKIYVARDPYGVRPLYCLLPNDPKNMGANLYGFASELKCLVDIYNVDPTNYTLQQFKPGTYSVLNLSEKVNCQWELLYNTPHHLTVPSNISLYNTSMDIIYMSVANCLYSSVIKRITTTERPIACLLSGGLDSSLIAALVNNYYKSIESNVQLETYSIGLVGSEDLKYAKIVADYLGTKHTEIIVTEKDMIDAIPEVIYAIESYDTTTVRASIGNYLIGKYIAQHSEAKVVLNGDGSDEVCGGYLYMKKCLDNIEYDKETRRLLSNIHYFDVLRSDKSISSHGLEPRTPFLDRLFVNYYLSIPLDIRNHNNQDHIEKYIVRTSFTNQYFKTFNDKQILPDVILWRKKEAFSDGVSSQNKSLYLIIQEHVSNRLNMNMDLEVGTIETNESHNNTIYEPTIETEKYYYKTIFDKYYPNCSTVIPYFWMPKYLNSNDPSARTLECYKSTTLLDEDKDKDKDNQSNKLTIVTSF
jgi:asparagine synthase (glutamine-hydrolysing)